MSERGSGSDALAAAQLLRDREVTRAERARRLALGELDSARQAVEEALATLARERADARDGWCEGGTGAELAFRRSGAEAAVREALEAVEEAQRRMSAAEASSRRATEVVTSARAAAEASATLSRRRAAAQAAAAERVEDEDNS